MRRAGDGGPRRPTTRRWADVHVTARHAPFGRLQPGAALTPIPRRAAQPAMAGTTGPACALGAIPRANDPAPAATADYPTPI